MSKKYNKHEIIKSKEFAGYQPDFLAVILDKEEYTLNEAKKAVKAFFEKKEG